VVALTINNSAFIGDLVRGAIERVPKGAALAGHSLGMSRLVILRRIVLPEVFREILPSITLMYISIIKLTSLASVVAVYEVTHVGDWIISTTYKPLEIFIVVAGIYIVILLPMTLAARRLETSRYFKRRTI
jgi:polar amino acid transport system permease protein